MFVATAVTLSLLTSVYAFSGFSVPARRISSLRMADIVDTAVGAGSFKTLAAALTAANLVATLKGPGPFTVFAPTDEAFGKLPAGTVDALLKDIPKLTGILTYHVVPGAVKAATVVTLNGKKVKTVNGAEVSVEVSNAGVTVDNAKVTKTDIICDNGVIHVIDSVILPSAPTPDIVDTAVAAGSFKTLAAALTAANLVETLKGPGPFTVFAPTDEAFGKLVPGSVEALLADIPTLTKILTYHVVPGAVKASTVVTLDGKKVKTVNGAEVTVGVSKAGVTVDNAKVVKTDIICGNGVIHVIDSVLIPK
jgi:transforming growth factor-beta-induced protein